MTLESYRAGRKHELLAYRNEAGEEQVISFLMSLADDDLAKTVAFLERASDEGPPKNEEKSKSVEGTRFFEFKSHQVRIFWRWTPRNQIVLMYGFLKKGARIPGADLAAGKRIYDAIELELRRENRSGPTR